MYLRPIKHDDVSPDIVDKFLSISVVDLSDQRDNRVLENDRENIRRKLAMEAGKEKTDSSCDLQLCFVNENTSSEDDVSEGLEIDSDKIGEANISTKSSQIIVPLAFPSINSIELGTPDHKSCVGNDNQESTRENFHSTHYVPSESPSSSLQQKEDNHSQVLTDFQVKNVGMFKYNEA